MSLLSYLSGEGQSSDEIESPKDNLVDGGEPDALNIDTSAQLQAEKVAPVAEDNHEGQEQNKMERFMKAIGREDLIEVLTPHKPWAYWTMEIYRNDIKGGGGLGMLASDTLEVAKSLGIPAVFITPFYRSEREQEVESFEQQMKSVAVTPEERGFHEVGDVSIDTRVDDEIVPTKLSVYAKQDGSVTLLTVTEPNFGELYQGANNSDHRLYQEVALGVGGYKAVKGFNLEKRLIGSELQKFKLVVTFNGGAFDLPKLKKELAIELTVPHLDLKPLCVNLGLKGGLKEVEQILELKRPAHLYGNPVDLWKAFHASGDKEYLELLIDYNKEDIENLKRVVEYCCKKMREKIINGF